MPRNHWDSLGIVRINDSIITRCGNNLLPLDFRMSVSGGQPLFQQVGLLFRRAAVPFRCGRVFGDVEQFPIFQLVMIGDDGSVWGTEPDDEPSTAERLGAIMMQSGFADVPDYDRTIPVGHHSDRRAGVHVEERGVVQHPIPIELVERVVSVRYVAGIVEFVRLLFDSLVADSGGKVSQVVVHRLELRAY